MAYTYRYRNTLHNMPARCSLLARRGGMLGTALFVLFALALLAGIAASFWMPKSEATIEKPLLSEVLNGPFENAVEEQGEVESSSNLALIPEIILFS